MKIVRLKTDGAVTWEQSDAACVTLKELQSAVGGYIERVPMPDSFPGDMSDDWYAS